MEEIIHILAAKDYEMDLLDVLLKIRIRDKPIASCVRNLLYVVSDKIEKESGHYYELKMEYWPYIQTGTVTGYKIWPHWTPEEKNTAMKRQQKYLNLTQDEDIDPKKTGHKISRAYNLNDSSNSS